MKYLIVLIFLLIQIPLFAEYIFLKDGKILEAQISAENDERITIKTKDLGDVELQRNKILRILFNAGFRKEYFIYLYDNTKLKGYLVAEDNESYTFRENLSKNQEKRIEKKAIKLLSPIEITQLKLGVKGLVGSGALFSSGVFLEIGKLELFLSGGLIYLDKAEEGMALPVKIQAAYLFNLTDWISLYPFVNGVYAVAIKNYHSQFGAGAGAGVNLFKILFVEGSYNTVFEQSDFVFGFGVKIPLSSF